nr:hypothetical protein [Alysiella crassa]UOP06515.1 hypothetical protein LVJ80_12265 [Alysiella crassa]
MADLSGALVRFELSQLTKISGSLNAVAVSQTIPISGAMVGVSVNQAARMPRTAFRLGLGQALPRKRRFLGSETIGISGDYDVQMVVNGLTFDMCELTDKIVITHGENEAYTCQFVIQKPINPRSLDGVEVDLYQWYGRKMTVNVVHSGGTLRIYHGTITSAQPEFATGKIYLSATDYRQRLIDTLPAQTVRAIGYTSKSAHGEFLKLSDELGRRMETIPASFEFDVYGRGYVNWWLPENPTHTMDNCMIYYRQPTARLAQVGEVVNRVNVELTAQTQRLLQRVLQYNYQVGIDVCNYTRYGQLPDLEEFNQAVSQTGWALWGFDFERVKPSGVYSCPQGRLMHRRDSVSATANSNGAYDRISRVRNLDVVSGRFEMVRRWVQNIGYRYDLTFENAASIARYGVFSDALSYNVPSRENELDGWTADFSPHRDGVKYQIDVMDELIAPFHTKPHFQKTAFTLAENGDWYADFNQDVDELNKTLEVAYHTARTKIWASHRQNTIDLQVKFMPHLSLKHSHRIDFKHIQTVAKVAHFSHEIDLKNGLSSTSIQYRFFQNGAHDTRFRLPELEQPEFSFPRYSKNLQLGRTELPRGTEVNDGHFGVIYRQATARLYDAIGMRIYAPEIEPASTDSVEFTQAQTHEIGIPNQTTLFKF